ncbi:flagellar hook-length control protein FliK [Halorhodospira neutriphila]|uniref:Flagellar hook-length control protein-like C-terminal domain-containing protein n=1 Tax=Halorhodospira neutriphila TaxID=168379 RepID=A0ABS1E4R6_9GAMM|nr:flagellar hook-length control protein FliK [Halorhodospira neutriphila]MBK1726082.1 hypothetical protein [Halorhodospira neutriphila]
MPEPDHAPSILIRYPEATGRPDLSLTFGATFEARVRRSPQGLILDFAGHRLPARTDLTDLEIVEGDRLLLRVAAIEPQLVLQTLRHRGHYPALHAGLRRALPAQRTAAGLAGALAPLCTPRRAFQSPARKAARIFAERLPTPAQLADPGGLREAVVDSGLFLEHRLAHTAAGARGAVATDLKANTARLLASLGGSGRAQPAQPATPAAGEPAHAELRDYAEGLFWRLQALQARLALEERPEDRTIDLPVRDGAEIDAVRLRLRGRPAPHGGGALKVDLHLHLSGAGAVYAFIQLQDGHVDAAWWAARRATADALAAALPDLEARLQRIGLVPGTLTCYHGEPAEDRTAPASAATPGIVNEQA